MKPTASPEERRVLLEDWNRVEPREEESGLLFHEFLERHATAAPGAPAVVCGGQTLTYGELNARANRLAHRLRALGVGPDVPVGIFLDRSPELVEAVFATLKAGGVCLPLDPATPAERLRLLLGESRARAVLTVAALEPRLPGPLPTVLIDAERAALGHLPATPPETPVGAANLSRVFFTSGSTGTPKGVLWRHGRVPEAGGWFQRTFQVTAADRFLLKASLAFTPINLEIYQPIMAGASIYIAEPGAERDTRRLLEHIESYRITILNIVPTMLRLLLEEEKAWRRCHSVRHVICFGEALPPELEEEFFAKSAASLTVIYGATEAPSSTWRQCVPGRVPKGVNIGRRLGNSQVLVLNEELGLAPIGAPGEICVSGSHLAVGYLNAPELTARKFLPNPFSPVPGARLYRTGDRGRYLPDGSLEFLGRTDDQVKIRGFRVELGEVEAALRRHPLVRDAAAAARTDASGAQTLIAYIAGAPAAARDEIRRFLRGCLPDYMVPGRWVFLENLPLTSTGKLDRKALPEPSAQSESAPPRTPMEARVARIWSEVFGLEQVGPEDHFFDLGGHSLLGMRLVAALREAVCPAFSPAHLLEAPTVAGQARLLERLASNPAAGAAPWRCLVELQRGEPARSPLFLVPGGGGGENEFLVYGRFIRHIGTQWPVYGFCARGLDGRQTPHTRTEAMAADYLLEMKARQPHGPYFIAGECVGGIVAYEMARRLRERGETVALLALFDTPLPSPALYLRALAETARKRLRESGGKLRQAHWYKLPRVFSKQWARFWMLMSDQWGRFGPNPFPGREDARVSYAKRVRGAYSRTLLRYRPAPCPGGAVFFASEEGGRRGFAPAWRPFFAGELEVRRLAGNHETYLRDHGQPAGAALGVCLGQTAARLGL